MSRQPYTYVVLRYAHDPASGEHLNVGVLIYSREARFATVKFDETWGRLSAVFAGFDGRAYRRTQRDFKNSIEAFQKLLNAPTFQEVPPDAASVGLRIWPDRSLSFQFGKQLGGVSSNLETTARELFDRFVTSQFTRRESKRREDIDVWRTVETKFDPSALEHLTPATVQTPYFEETFQRTFRNERLHVVEPLSFDYADAGSIIETATRWRGRLDVIGTASPKPSEFHFIVGEPRRHRELLNAANKAVDMIKDSAGVIAEVVMESAVDQFAATFSQLILQHVN